MLSITIFNEGVDIKKAKNAIILASTTNPREFVQRRGRVLRKEKDVPKVANIYDFFVYSSIDEAKTSDLEKSIIIKEFSRISYFAKESNNFHDLLDNSTLLELIKVTGYQKLF